EIEVPDLKIHPVLKDTIIIGNCKQAEINCVEKEVIVDAVCGAAVLRGAHIYAPGVMGMLPGIHCGDTVSVFADRLGKCKKGLAKPFLDDTRFFIGNGIACMERKHLFGENLKPTIVIIRLRFLAHNCSFIKTLKFRSLPFLHFCINLPSIVCCHVLNPQKNECILDMCAAPGNKTSHIATLMEDKGLIVALDKTENKVNSIKKRCHQFGIRSVHPFVCDATKIPNSAEFQEQCNSVLGHTVSSESFDRVLLDAPCSALGQRPQLINKTSVKQLKSYPCLQRKFFQLAVSMLKPGGILVYSTCTITMAENEEIVHWALKNYPNLKLEPSLPVLGGPGLKNSKLSETERLCVQRFGPTLIDDCDHDTVGFFLARFQKKSANLRHQDENGFYASCFHDCQTELCE
ncbi:hypothetical protein L9F63_021846, partial [Diploptera punctata]